MNIKIIKPALWSVLVLVSLYLILFLLEQFFGSSYGFNNYIFGIFWFLTALIFFGYNKFIFSDIKLIEPKEKRVAIRELVLISIYFIALIFFKFSFPEVFLSTLISTLVLIIGIAITVYLAVRSLYLCKGKIYILSFVDFIASIAIYVISFLLASHDNSAFGMIFIYFGWPFALVVLIVYIIVWRISFLRSRSKNVVDV